MNPVLPNIALIGRMGTGKTTIADLLMQHFGYHRFSWAAPVKAIAQLAYGPIKKDQFYEVVTHRGRDVRTGRQILQRIGTDALRENVDQDFWIKAGLRTIELDPVRNLVNDDTRFRNEADALARRGFALVKVVLPEDQRVARLTAAYGPQDSEILNHESELDIDRIPTHLEIWNTADAYHVAMTLMDTLATLTTRTA
jgi:dephospho-CoA kinase